MKYKASLDSTSKTVTLLISVLFLSILLFQSILFIQYRTWTTFAVSLLLILIYALTYGYHPVHYAIRNSNVIVHRYLSDVTVLRSDIKNMELVDMKQMKGTIRTFGVGGVFGYFGQFLNRDIGCMTWYATRRDYKAILIELNNSKKIIITPDEPEQFLQDLSLAA